MATIFVPPKERLRAAKRGVRPRWWYRFRDEDGRPHEHVGCSDKEVTKRLAGKEEADVLLRRRGVVDPAQHRLAEHAKTPLSGHLADYEAALLAKGSSPRHVAETTSYIQKAFESLAWRSVRDIVADRLQRHLADQRRQQDTGARTLNARLVAIKGFTIWLTRHGRVPADPLASLRKVRESDDRRRVRRVLDDDEMARLLAAAQNGPTLWGITGPDRQMFYLVLAGSGLRRSEAASITRASFDLDAPNGPVVAVAAGYTKNKRETRQPLPADLAQILRPWLAAKPDDGSPLWPLPDRPYQRLMVPDLVAAGIDPGAEGGPVVDFHSFRHGYVTRLVRAGVPIKVTQQLARHSSPVLTMNVYAHLGLADERAGLDRAFGAGRVNMNGANGATARKLANQRGQQVGGVAGQDRARRGTNGARQPGLALAPSDPRKPQETPGVVA